MMLPEPFVSSARNDDPQPPQDDSLENEKKREENKNELYCLEVDVWCFQL